MFGATADIEHRQDRGGCDQHNGTNPAESAHERSYCVSMRSRKSSTDPQSQLARCPAMQKIELNRGVASFPVPRRYFLDWCDPPGCLNDLLSPSHVARLTTLPKSWSLCFRRKTLLNLSRYSKLFCSLCGSAMLPMAAKSCCACVHTKSFKVLCTRALSIAQSQAP